MPDLGALFGTWTCMCCGAERPDANIDVAHRPAAGLEDGYPATRVNVRYCNDQPACAAHAHADGPWDGRILS